MRSLRRRVVTLAAAAFLLAFVGGAALGARPGGGSGTLTVSDAAVLEGNTGTTSLSFTVQLSGPAKVAATVFYATANGTATAPADFGATSGTLSLGKRNRTRTVVVQVVGDTVDEVDETFTLKLSNASGATIADGSGLGSILDDDGGVTGIRIAAAGDIACDPASSSFNAGMGVGLECRQRATSDLLVGAGYEAVLALGDLQYEDGAFSKFGASYDPSWGRVKAITHPAVGNHEYGTSGAAGYYQYFGAAAGDPTKGYYSFDLGGWHLIALNSNCAQVGGCGAGSTQEEWLRADLSAHAAAPCTLAFWHHPRFSSGEHGSDGTYTAFWQALFDASADVVLVGHDHDYERFAPQSADGTLDTTRGIREFVVGSGGKNLRTFPTVRANSEARTVTSAGVLELALGASGYSWRFVAVVGTFTDGGTASCH
ncbi:MAG: metallophosphoesterase [Thermoleophilia bacterium]|nr:metallophosphoesterase [Thermoleophilia bacterium]MDH4340312.1 metallophosphoesterase [Thermoleophilia bacterium]